MSVKTSSQGWPCGYDYDGAGARRQFRCDMASGRTPIFHMRLLHPTSDTLGFSPLEAAAQAVDIHNEGGRWTKALLDNSARPSGALIYKAGDGAQMSDDQFTRIKAELEGAYAGARHAGRPMVLEGGLEWRSMSLSPADMDFLEARREAAREIALALGVPPMLLGIPGDNTYANYKEANLAFWRQTIIPLVTKTARGLEGWLRPWLGEDLIIRPDLDAVPALSAERAALWKRLSEASFLTDTERRALAGLEVVT
jgi:HK97 family phage portal protein